MFDTDFHIKYRLFSCLYEWSWNKIISESFFFSKRDCTCIPNYDGSPIDYKNVPIEKLSSVKVLSVWGTQHENGKKSVGEHWKPIEQKFVILEIKGSLERIYCTRSQFQCKYTDTNWNQVLLQEVLENCRGLRKLHIVQEGTEDGSSIVAHLLDQLPCECSS